MKLCGFDIGLHKPLFLIAGPCVVESAQLQMDTAGTLKEITASLGIPFIFKSSYDKANRSSDSGFRGLGTERGLEIFPRLVSPEVPKPYQRSSERVHTGVPGLDRMLVGGLWRGSNTLIAGPSGSGKSTFLRLIMGLVKADAGSVRVGDVAVTAANAREIRRRIGYVIQDGGLFPHLSAEQNVSLVARLDGWPEVRQRARVRELAEIVARAERDRGLVVNRGQQFDARITIQGLAQLVFFPFFLGAAGDGTLHVQDGVREWGWREDGTFVDQFPGVFAPGLVGAARHAHSNVLATFSVTPEHPVITLHSQGGEYHLATATTSTVWDLKVHNGDGTRFEPRMNNGKLRGFTIHPGSAAVRAPTPGPAASALP